MKYSYQWLRELSGTKKTPEELAEFLTMRAFEVESVEKVGFDTPGVVIGEVTSAKKHPNADRLRVTSVHIGTETLQIVCGAPNVAVGQKVPVAKVGTKLSGRFEIRQSEIRDVASYGMICSEDELGLGNDHSGILVLPDAAPVGEELRNFLNDTDFLLDIKVLPDRAHDALGHVGMAREIVALEGGDLEYDSESLKLDPVSGKHASVFVDPQTGSARYSGALIQGITVKDSPKWLRNRLRKLGVRSVNNVVDATNFVMYELGQPLHAFDWDALAEDARGGKTLSVRFAKEGEILQLLDGRDLALTTDDVVIADAKAPLALAGVMGGCNSGVSASTESIFLESAHFDPISIRKTRTRFDARTDASDRFEKAIDPNMTEKALVRVLELLEHIAGGKCAQTIDWYPQVVLPKNILVSLRKAKSLLGMNIREDAAKAGLERMGYGVRVKEKGIWEVKVPTFRLDVVSSEDVMEDMAKILGYDAVAAVSPSVALQGVEMKKPFSLERRLSDDIRAAGFTEVLNYAFYGCDNARALGLEESDHLRLANPMNPDQALMRASLLPGLLKNIRENLKHEKELRLFECGNVFFTSDFQPVHESRMFGVALVSNDAKENVFFELKGVIDRLLCSVGVKPLFDVCAESGRLWHPTRTAEVFGEADGKALHLGRVGEVHPFALERFHLKRRVAYGEFDVNALVAAASENSVFEAPSRYPEVLRDISFFAPKSVLVKEVVDGIAKHGAGLVIDAELFDLYFDKERQMKSFAFHLRFGVFDRTLSGEEVDAAIESIVDALSKKFKLERRIR